MSLGSWIPEGEKASISLPTLEQLAQWSRADETSIDNLDASALSHLSATVQSGVDVWLAHLSALPDENLLGLVRFFTLLEMRHNSCRADQHSPAIACSKLLRQRGNKLDKELLTWIRSVSDNRYLPYGPL